MITPEIDTFDVAELLVERLRSGEGKICFMGHFNSKEDFITYDKTSYAKHERERPDVEWMVERYNKIFVDYLAMRMGSNAENMRKWFDGDVTDWTPVAKNDCHVCGERVVTYYNGATFMFATRNAMKQAEVVGDECLKCEFAGGMGEYTVEIDVPSGRLVFANDLRRFMPEEIEDHYVNYDIGVRNTVIDTAKQNFLTAFVGNTCPSVLQDGDVINIGNEGRDEVTDEVCAPIGGSDEIGSICTDLWWFYAMDGGAYEKANTTGEDFVEADAKVTPGRYQMTVYPRKGGRYDPSKAEHFVKIERIG